MFSNNKYSKLLHVEDTEVMEVINKDKEVLMSDAPQFQDEKSLELEVREGITLDSLISKAGAGKYQYLAFFFVGLVVMFDGSEAIVLALLISILKNEWGGSTNSLSQMGSMVFFGLLLGSIGAGQISDRFGRKKPLVYTVLAQYICATLCAFVSNIYQLTLVRAMLGFFQGFQVPLSSGLLSEITPKEVRGKFLVSIGIIYAIGELFTCFAGSFTLTSTQSGNWRALLLIVAQPALLGWIGLLFFLDESPRYQLIVKKDVDTTVEIVERIAHINGNPLVCSEVDKQGLAHWVASHPEMNKKGDAGNVKILFNQANFEVTKWVWPTWAMIVLVNHGVLFILPSVLAALGNQDDVEQLEKGKHDIMKIAYAAIGEIPAVLIAGYLVEHEAYGRRRTVILGFLVASAACFGIWLFSYFGFFITLAKASISLVSNVNYTYTLELYPTNVRVTGLGTAYSFGRLGQIAMPWIAMALFHISPKDPYLGYAVFALIGAFFSWNIKKDTTQQDLN